MGECKTPLVPLIEALQDVGRWMEATGTPHVITGGVAASLLGRPRTTQDIDVLGGVENSRWPALVDSAREYGIAPRVDDWREFAGPSRALLMRHYPTDISVDFILAELPYEHAIIEKGKAFDVGGIQVKLPQVEDLVVMKLLARRPRDIGDLEGLIQTTPNLDWNYIRHWVGLFAKALNASDIIDALYRLQGSVPQEQSAG